MNITTLFAATILALGTPSILTTFAAEGDGAVKPTGLSTTGLSDAEKSFQETLNNAVFKGRWCLIKDGELGEERSEKYTILRANKLGGNNWLIFTRVQYGQKDVTVPIPVQVKWAGDTPVITLDNLAIPNLGTYSARVVVYKGSYAGHWSAGDHGGMLHGLIEKGEETKPAGEAKPNPKE